MIREGESRTICSRSCRAPLEVHTGEGTDDHVVATLDEGDYFGEIGLLEKRPRTATVIATSESALYRIPGEDFLRIVNEGPRLSPTLVSVVANRLAASDPYEELGHS